MGEPSESSSPCGVIIGDYRGIDRLELPIKPLTLLVGRNNVGKSNVLQALGHDPFSPGEEERAEDPRPQLSWVHELDIGAAEAQAWLSNQIEILGVNSDLVVPLARKLLRSSRLITWVERGRSVIGLSRLGLDRIDMLSYMAERGIERIGWLDELMESVARAALFVPVGESSEPDTGPVKAVSTTTVYVDADDVTEHLTRRVRELLHLCYRSLADSDSNVAEALTAVDEGQMGPLERLGLLQPVIMPLEDAANRLAPAFVAEQGSIGISVHQGADDSAGVLRRVLSELRAELDDDGSSRAKELADAAAVASASADCTFDLHLDSSFFETTTSTTSTTSIRPYSRLGRGTRRWIAASLVEAADRLEAHIRARPAPVDAEGAGALLASFGEQADASQPSGIEPGTGARRVRLLDEPGESLHPLAQRDVLNWLEERVEEGDVVVFSAHQPAMLQATVRPEDVMVVGLERHQGRTRPIYLPGPLMNELESNTRELGITKAELLLQARGVLIVEGADDVDVLTKLYGAELTRHSILVQSIGGSSSRAVVDLLESSVFRLLDTPAWVMFDKTSAESLEAQDTPEAACVAEMLAACSDPAYPQVRALPFEPPDILCGFRPGLVKQLFPHLLESTWPSTVKLWSRQAGAESFKSWARRRARVRQNFSPGVIQPLVRAATGGPGDASHWLQQSMEALFEQVAEAR